MSRQSDSVGAGYHLGHLEVLREGVGEARQVRQLHPGGDRARVAWNLQVHLLSVSVSVPVPVPMAMTVAVTVRLIPGLDGGA